MVWIMIVTVAAIVAAVILIWNMQRQKKELYGFVDWLEYSLDEIIKGKEIEADGEMEDTLSGKISERLKRINQIGMQKEQEAQNEKNMIKELVSDISHQTKTPVANIRMYMEFLQEEQLSDEGKKFLENMEGQTAKLDFLLQSMVKMSRLETGIINIQSQKTDLKETLGIAVSAIVPKAEQKNIKLYVDCPDGVLLWHDKKWTAEALFNVLDNAVKYTGDGGSIHISSVVQEMFVRLSVRDTGKGIAVGRQAQIFTRFYREPEVHDKEGVGIGLYLARKIIELQDGYITVVSEAGEGAEFQIYLPCKSKTL